MSGERKSWPNPKFEITKTKNDIVSAQLDARNFISLIAGDLREKTQ
jgi:hypothetical protein